ncbi:hypothetical protein AQJ46_47825 [Streptomyces canus]|uniref:Uncharacterized protein n=1 Tax=Streptomyces canus TaxID=58343 RepID=A0A117QW39_9ACTN|nr:hypothetical protein [Streptomyces canus]KUN57446.1 hypothetical protein AQJ46_47825 [Streptomyces canus]
MRRILNRIDTQIDTGHGWHTPDESDRTGGAFTIPSAFSAEFEISRYDTLGLADGATVAGVPGVVP